MFEYELLIQTAATLLAGTHRDDSSGGASNEVSPLDAEKAVNGAVLIMAAAGFEV